MKQGLPWFKLHMPTTFHAVYAFNIDYTFHIYFLALITLIYNYPPWLLRH